MKKIVLLLFLILWTVPCFAKDIKHELIISRRDRFVIVKTSEWKIQVQRYRPLSLAYINISPKQGKPFDLQLYFDISPLGSGKFDSPEKIKQSVKVSSEQYLPQTVEKSVELRELTVAGWYGWYTVLTDAKLATLAAVPAGEFKYITRGVIRLSQDSVLGFSLLTNTLETEEYQKPFGYILSFVKGGPQIFTFGQKPENYPKPYGLIKHREIGRDGKHDSDSQQL